MFWKNENVKLKKGDAFHFYGDSALFFRENAEKRRRSGSVRAAVNAASAGSGFPW